MRLPEEKGLTWNVIAVHLRTHILQVHPRSADHGHLNGQVTAVQMEVCTASGWKIIICTDFTKVILHMMKTCVHCVDTKSLNRI